MSVRWHFLPLALPRSSSQGLTDFFRLSASALSAPLAPDYWIFRILFEFTLPRRRRIVNHAFCAAAQSLHRSSTVFSSCPPCKYA